ncbi:uncharacterized protein LOC142237541 [Haematobia irritans]|uniref:uncharacterized protein LOC142237541 n=1 Tax=Haematobia irritans TaxID=7368 RepID=UPI003F4FEF75
MSYFNDDEVIPPSWINKEFLEKVLTKYERQENIKILKFELSPACMKGDHYSTAMSRCKVEYNLNDNVNKIKKSVIIKTLPSGEGMKRDLLLESKVFETEIDMYTKTLPKIEKILAQFGEPTKLSAGIVYHSLEPHKIIILEDLCDLGYEAIRGRFLTEDELKSVFGKLAKLHAVSYMLGQSDDPESVTKYQDGFMCKPPGPVKEIIKNGLNNFIELLLSDDELKTFADKIKDIQDEVQQACSDMFNAYTLSKGLGNDILVLNHGDFHIKNLMFKFNDNEQMVDPLMVDFQGSCYAPSNLDMVYSQFLLLSPDIRLKRHKILYYYFMEFIRILKKIEYDGRLPKYSELQISNLKYRHFTLCMLAVFYPLVVPLFYKSAEDLKNINTNDMIENPDVVALNYKLPFYIEELRTLMPIFLNEGYFD